MLYMSIPIGDPPGSYKAPSPLNLGGGILTCLLVVALVVAAGTGGKEFNKFSGGLALAPASGPASTRTRSGGKRPEVQENKNIQFNYAIFGDDHVMLNDQCLIGDASRRPSADNELQRLHAVKCASERVMSNGTITRASLAHVSMGSYCGGEQIVMPPALLAPEDKPAIDPWKACGPHVETVVEHPDEVLRLGFINGSLKLVPGDYIVYSLVIVPGRKIELPKGGPVRIFVQDNPHAFVHLTPAEAASKQRELILSRKPIIHFAGGNEVNAHTGRFGDCLNLAIWYNGARPIVIGGGVECAATIYAPNAPIKIGPGRVRITGAVVGKSVETAGDVAVYYDRGLDNLTFLPL